MAKDQQTPYRGPYVYVTEEEAAYILKLVKRDRKGPDQLLRASIMKKVSDAQRRWKGFKTPLLDIDPNNPGR